MTVRTVSLTPPPDPGDTLLLDGRPHVVLHRLPKLPGRRPAVRVSADLPCGACETAPLRYDAPRRRWWCPSCSIAYDRAALAVLAGEHVADGVRTGRARQDRGSRARQVARGAPGASVVLASAAAAGGAPSRAALLETVTGGERRALAWVLQDAGEAPLSAARCLEAAQALANVTPASIEAAP